MGFKRFSILIAVRTLLIVATATVLVMLIQQGDLIASSVLVFILLAILCVDMHRFVAKTNQELTRFLDAARYGDFSQRFELKGVGAGFDELGIALTDILKRFHDVRTNQEEEYKYLKAMVEHVPVPLLAIDFEDKVSLLNNSARRLFGNHTISKLADFSQFSSEVVAKLSNIVPGDRLLISLEIDGMTHQLSISTTHVIIEQQKQKLISLQDIRNELDEAQLSAWQDLVRVLTHEIMNSITPITSLAQTAEQLTQDLQDKAKLEESLKEDLDDLHHAVSTVARRSDGLMNFVSSYRQLTRLPVPKKQAIRISDLLDNAISLGALDWVEKGIALDVEVNPTELEVSIDTDMIERILINLLKNAEHALEDTASPRVKIDARLNRRGHAIIEITDNGPGIPDEIKRKVFVPFFTTKREGTGVGLALSRQTMIAHGGNIVIEETSERGTCFKLTF